MRVFVHLQQETDELVWPSTQAIVFTQCCLVSSDSESLEKVDLSQLMIPTIDKLTIAHSEVVVRAQLVRLWLLLQTRDDFTTALEGNSTIFHDKHYLENCCPV